MPKKVDFSKLFADTKAIPDDFVVKVGDAEYTMADIREYDKQRGGEVQAALESEQEQLKKDKAALQTASERVAKTYIELEAEKQRLVGAKPADATGGDPLAAYEADQVFAPVVKQLRKVEAEHSAALKAIDDKMKKIVESVGQMGVTYMGDKATRDFADIMAQEDPVRPKDLNLDALYKIAVEQRIYDRNNLPDIRKTYDNLTRDARHQHELKAAEARGRESLAREQQEAAMLPMPSGVHPSARQGAEMPKNLNDAFGKAGQDRELWKAVNQPTLIGGGSIQ